MGPRYCSAANDTPLQVSKEDISPGLDNFRDTIPAAVHVIGLHPLNSSAQLHVPSQTLQGKPLNHWLSHSPQIRLSKPGLLAIRISTVQPVLIQST
jgi:hypothetical protein